jgi:predicted alpha/beta hydrolase
MTDYKTTTIAATDGYPLSARLYRAPQAKGIVVIASATGVAQGFYSKFARYGVSQHYTVVTFDYRGIGESAPATLQGFHMDYRDWAEKDLAAVLHDQHGSTLPLFLVGHSYGGHAIGLTSHALLRAAYTFGTGAGWHGWMPLLERIRVSIMWNVVAPVIVKAKGYLGWSALGMGEDLPLGVYQQWKRWCHFPHYFFDDPHYPEMQSKFDEVTLPIKAVNSIDDLWALPRSRDAFMPHYRHAKLECVDLKPNNIGIKNIGHMGYFYGAAQALWSDVFAYFDQHKQSI